jgi:hypothetical protein
MHHLLAYGFFVGNDDGVHRILQGFVKEKPETFRLLSEEVPDALSAGQHADNNPGARHTLNVVKNHRRALAGRPFDGSAGAHITIYPGQLGMSLHGLVRFDKLSGIDFNSSRADLKSKTVFSRGMSVNSLQYDFFRVMLP